MPKPIDDALAEIKAKVKTEVKTSRTDAKDGKGIKKATGETWRLVHDGKRMIALVEGSPFDATTSKHTIFIGTREECEEEAGKLKPKKTKQVDK